jgi:hypothetical protein
VRRLVLGLTLACLLTLHAAPAEAGRNAMGYVLYGSFVDPTIEQQTDLPFGSGNVVTNPYRATPCAWDVDDHWYSIAEGTLRAGQSLTKTECVVSSPAGFFVSVNGNWGWYYYALGWYGVQVKADVGTLDVRVCYDVEDYCITATPTQVAGSWVYNSCSLAAYSPDDPTVQDIPGSNGGRGVVHQVTTTVTNPTGRNVRSFSSMVGSVGVYMYASGWGGCVQGAPVVYDYPFSYAG